MGRETSINLDDDLEEEEDDLIRTLVEDTLTDPRPGKILTYWRIMYRSTLGRACTDISGASTYSKINSILNILGNAANMMTVMEYAIDMRVNEIPPWPGAEIRDPSLGFLCGADRLRGLLEKIDKSEEWAKKRAVYNYVYYGRDRSRMRRNMGSVEFNFLVRFLPDD